VIAEDLARAFTCGTMPESRALVPRTRERVSLSDEVDSDEHAGNVDLPRRRDDVECPGGSMSIGNSVVPVLSGRTAHGARLGRQAETKGLGLDLPPTLLARQRNHRIASSGVSEHFRFAPRTVDTDWIKLTTAMPPAVLALTNEVIT
jgi:hypothetical protein